MRIAALDETGQAKQGTATYGVKRQYMGCAGRLANGINTLRQLHPGGQQPGHDGQFPRGRHHDAGLQLTPSSTPGNGTNAWTDPPP